MSNQQQQALQQELAGSLEQAQHKLIQQFQDPDSTPAKIYETRKQDLSEHDSEDNLKQEIINLYLMKITENFQKLILLAGLSTPLNLDKAQAADMFEALKKDIPHSKMSLGDIELLCEMTLNTAIDNGFTADQTLLLCKSIAEPGLKTRTQTESLGETLQEINEVQQALDEASSTEKPQFN